MYKIFSPLALTLLTFNAFSQEDFSSFQIPNEYLKASSKSLQDKGTISKADYPIEANYYSFAPEFGLELGRGFSPYHIDEIKQSPFTYDITNIEGNGTNNSSFDYKVALNKSELEKLLDIDVKLKASIFGVETNSFLHIVENTKFNESSLCIVIKGSCEFGRSSINNLKLKPEAKYLAKYNYKKFKDIYGSKIPVMVRRGASVYIVIQITNISSDLRKEINAGIKLSSGGLVASTEFDFKLRSEIKDKRSSNNMNLNILSNGGGGLGELSELIKNLDANPSTENSFLKIRDGLSTYFKSFNVANAAPLGFLCAEYKDVAKELTFITPDLYAVEKEKCLAQIIENYRSAEAEVKRIGLIQQRIDPIYPYLSEDEISKIPLYISSLKSYQGVLRKIHFKYSDLDPLKVEFDKLDIPIKPELNLRKIKEFICNYVESNTKLNITASLVQDIDLYMTDPNTFVSYHVGFLIPSNNIIDIANFPTPPPNTEIDLVNNNFKIKKDKIQNLITAKANLLNSDNGFEIIVRIRTKYTDFVDFKIGKVRPDHNGGCTFEFFAPFQILSL